MLHRAFAFPALKAIHLCIPEHVFFYLLLDFSGLAIEYSTSSHTDVKGTKIPPSHACPDLLQRFEDAAFTIGGSWVDFNGLIFKKNEDIILAVLLNKRSKGEMLDGISEMLMHPKIADRKRCIFVDDDIESIIALDKEIMRTAILG